MLKHFVFNGVHESQGMSRMEGTELPEEWGGTAQCDS
jgi:hypothetical protein